MIKIDIDIKSHTCIFNARGTEETIFVELCMLFDGLIKEQPALFITALHAVEQKLEKEGGINLDKNNSDNRM